MPGINHVLLVGRLTKDPELMKTKNGISFCRFSVAIDRPKKKDEDSPGSDFPGCVAWRQQADFITSYGSKGCMVSVEGNTLSMLKTLTVSLTEASAAYPMAFGLDATVCMTSPVEVSSWV